jgi:hypothetical protein
MPSTNLDVQPFHVAAQTGSTSALPSTSLDVKPFDIQLGWGGHQWEIRPFSITGG